MKKLLAVLLMAALVATLGLGCAPAAPAAPAEPAAPAAGDAVKIGVTIANFDDTFLTYMMDGMKASEARWKALK